MTSPDQTAYIGTLDGDGVVVATVRDGALTVTGALPEVREPSALAFSADRSTLYAVSELPDGVVTAVDISDPQRPVVLTSQPSGGAGPTHLEVFGKHLVTAHYSDGVVASHPIGSDGSLGPLGSALLLETPGSAASPHAHQVVPDPSGRWLLATALGLDAVFVLRFDQATGALAEHSRMDLPAGTGPRHLVFHPDGTRVFVLGELRPTVTAAAWDATAGTLERGDSAHVTGPGAPDPTYPAEIISDGAGRFLYATTRGEDAVGVLRIGPGAPQLVQTSPAGGAWPRHCALGPGGTWLYVATQRPGSVVWLPRDPATGLLGPVAGEVTVRGACWVAFA
ncbi:lactonase family protein [Actinokineospora globicatena]|uniref:lactonase family protein n=1 Tax=Actinokineospora globicatena TaxID=103729 RepID=UPI0020A309FE|nr:lactonase family protein [Actinokineospora globicatena]MCP2306831.1 6-phosphogluconolactonase, cycloisomerase 2 family [Actinokineospora globicatena]GLW82272.1 3-carboxymuconate cyclase [Actinokineospora globicatena]GLW89135.1 3-carboxymuconate cyclase [Actinokineospora globicatena]